MNHAISVNNLRKSYGAKQVLKGVSFNVPKGQVMALLGVNGAGKTTTIEIIENLRPADAGKIQVNGSIGVQLQSTALPDAITVREAMKLFCTWHKVAYRADLLERFDVSGEWLNKTYGALSTGRKRRLHLALALAHNPDIVILDEPTAGLDVEGRHALHAEIRQLKSKGVSILMATHDMAEAEDLADHIAILANGVVERQGTPRELTAAATVQSRVLVKTKHNSLAGFSALSEFQNDGYRAYAVKDAAEFLVAMLTHVKLAGDEISDLRVERASIEDIFLDVAGALTSTAK